MTQPGRQPGIAVGLGAAMLGLTYALDALGAVDAVAAVEGTATDADGAREVPPEDPLLQAANRRLATASPTILRIRCLPRCASANPRATPHGKRGGRKVPESVRSGTGGADDVVIQ